MTYERFMHIGFALLVLVLVALGWNLRGVYEDPRSVSATLLVGYSVLTLAVIIALMRHAMDLHVREKHSSRNSDR